MLSSSGCSTTQQRRFPDERVSGTSATSCRRRTWLLILLLILSGLSSGTTASVVQFSPDEREALRRAFLRKFGLEQLETAMDVEAGGGGGGQRSAKVPAYLWDLYERHQRAPETVPDGTIRHYTPSTHDHEDGDEEGTVWMVFNLSATGRVPHRERILRAELHLPEGVANNTVVRVHKVQSIRERPESIAESIEFTRAGRGTARAEVAILLQGHFTDQLILALMMPRDNAATLTKRHMDAVALIVHAESAEAEEEKRRGRRRKKRWAPEAAEDGAAQNNSMADPQRAGSNSSRQRRHRKHRKDSAANSQHTMCRRAELYVDFRQLNWNDWIIAPSGYDAYQCRGRCTHPIPHQLNTTNHALVQSLIHSINPQETPAPSCVPIKMSAVSILYRDMNDVYVLKPYEDMRVEACGCH